MSSREFAEWIAYYRLEPFGETRADLRAAIVACTIANANRNPKKQRRPFKPADFMPEFGARPQQSWQSQLALIEMLNEVFGGKDLRTK
jgi:hypothetical protein